MRIIKIEADICPQCKALDLILKATPEVNSLVEKINIDREENKHWIEDFDIMGTPTLLFLREEDGQELGRIVGARGITPDIILEKYKSLL